MPPDRAAQFVLEMREPVGRLDENGTLTRFRPRQASSVGRGGVADVLAKPRGILHGSTGTFVSHPALDFDPQRDNPPMAAEAAAAHSHWHYKEVASEQ